MEYLEVKINQLIVETTGQGDTFVRSFTTKPEPDLLRQAGKIFGLVEIKSTDPLVPKLIDLIIEEIKNNYYQQDWPTKKDLSYINKNFEAALKKTNLAIASFLETQQLALDLEKVNIIIAVADDKELHFAIVGDLVAVLFYNVSRYNYRIINILETSQSPATPPDPLKLFSQIISGKIGPRDILFISTLNILDYFSIDKIKNILTDQLPVDGISELKQLTGELDSRENFAALAVDLDRMTAPIKKITDLAGFDYNKAASQDSIRNLIKTEKETAKFLTPSIMPEIKKYTGSLNTAFKNYLNKVKSSSSTFYQKQKIPPRPKMPKAKSDFRLGARVQKFGKISSTSLKRVSAPVKPELKKIVANIIHHPLGKEILGLIKRLFGNFGVKFNRLPRSSKILLVLTLALAILFANSIIWLGIKNTKEKRIEELNQIIVDVENKKNEAQASLIFRDEGLARELLVEARGILIGLDTRSEAQKQQIELLITDIESQLDDLRHIIDINEPVQVVNFQNLDSQANLADLMALSRKTIYTQNRNNQSIYKANLDTRILSAIFSPDANTGNLKFEATINNNELLFFNDEAKLFQLSPGNDTIQPITIDLPQNSAIVAATAYNNRLYLLDTANSQIYRFQKAGSGYGGLRNWITEGGINLRDAISLVVDGSVYVLKSNGEVVKFQNGRVTDFQISLVDPPFESPTKIKTVDTSNFLYILDPPTKRLVVLDKEGNLINQYFSEKFDDLKDFIVLENEKEIYLLNGSVIFGVPAEHL